MNIRTDHVSVFVVRPAGDSFEFLQLRRCPGDYLGGSWQTMRGTAEAGENSMQTALRELREETGVTPKEFYSLGIVETFYIVSTDTLFHSPTFVAIVQPDAKITLDAEHDAHRWIDQSDAENLFMWPSEMPLLCEIKSKILRPSGARSRLRLI